MSAPTEGGRRGGRSRTRLEPERRAAEILRVAERLFRQHDYAAVSLEAIADEAGVTRGLLHHYFGSKRSLYLDVVRRAVHVPPETRLVPPDATGDFAEVIAMCVDGWLSMIAAAGDLWSGSTGSFGFGDNDLDRLLVDARDDLVRRMIDELPFQPGLDRELLAAALRSYAALARVAGQEWLRAETLTRSQAAALLRTTLIAIVEESVPAMQKSE